MLRIAQGALHLISLTDLFNQTPTQLLWEASSHMLQLMREGCSYTYPSLSIAGYSFMQLSEMEQCRVKQLAQGFNTALQDSNLVLLIRESDVLPPELLRSTPNGCVFIIQRNTQPHHMHLLLQFTGIFH